MIKNDLNRLSINNPWYTFVDMDYLRVQVIVIAVQTNLTIEDPGFYMA